MVQFVTLPRTRSVGQAIAEGLGEGISKGVEMGLQERMEQRRQDRQEEKVKTNILNYAQAKADKLGIGKNKAAVGFIYQTGLIDPKAMVEWDPGAEELEHLQADLKEHQNDSFKPEAEQEQPQVQQQQNNKYPMQTGYGQQAPQSAIKSTNVNPLAVPPGQITPQQPGTIKGPSEVSPYPKPAIRPPEPTTEEDRFRTVTIKGKPIQVVKSPRDVRTVDEARTYADVVLPKSKQKEFMTSARADINARAQEQKIPYKMGQEERQRGDKFQAEMDLIGKGLSAERTSLDLTKRAIRSGNTEGWLQTWASQNDWQPFRSPEAAIVDAAAKEFLMNTVGTIGQKGTNMFMEARALSMYPKTGMKKEAALISAAFQEADLKLKEKKLQINKELKPQYKGKESELEQAVNEKLYGYTKSIVEETSIEISNIKDEFADKEELLSTQEAWEGKYATKPRIKAMSKAIGSDVKALEALRIMGYGIPNEDPDVTAQKRRELIQKGKK